MRKLPTLTLIAAAVFVKFGAYRYAFFTASALALVALVALARAHPPEQPAVRSAPL